ncbi:MAG: methyltransferase, FxLD system [Mycobacteriales bacterium]
MSTDDPGELRQQLVDRLSSAGRITHDSVAAAFRVVPRHVFLPGVEPVKAYADEAIPTKWASDGRPISSSSQPSIMAIMLEQLRVEPGQRVLEIGTGTGYNAALLSRMVGEAGMVTTIDIDADLVGKARRHLAAAGLDQVKVVCADGADGWAERAPYDRIILTAGAHDMASAWFDQLAPNGRLVLPLSLRGAQRSVAFERAADHLVSVSIMDCGFMPLRGALATPDSARRLGESGLFLHLGDEREVDTGALYAALREPGADLATGMSVTPADVTGGLGLWLALHERDIGQLSALGSALERGLVPAVVVFPGVVLTTVLIGERALASLVRLEGAGVLADRFDLGVRLFGPKADDLGRRLMAHVHAWDTRGRPSTAELRIRAYPRAGVADDGTQFVIDMRHARLLLDW